MSTRPNVPRCGSIAPPSVLGTESECLMLRRVLIQSMVAVGVVAALPFAATPVFAQSAPAAAEEAPDALIKRLSEETLAAIKADKDIQAGNVAKISALVDSKIMPNVNFQRMTASAVGRAWREATPEQRKKLQDEFKLLLIRTYSGALAQVKDQTIAMKPLRAQPGDAEVLVRSEVRGKGDPIQLDYRLEKADKGWKIYDLNVLGIWMVQSYQGQFAAEINKGGLDGLINALAERNKSAKK
jgi:phospholipid transport system substrate-binding protein